MEAKWKWTHTRYTGAKSMSPRVNSNVWSCMISCHDSHVSDPTYLRDKSDSPSEGSKPRLLTSKWWEPKFLNPVSYVTKFFILSFYGNCTQPHRQNSVVASWVLIPHLDIPNSFSWRPKRHWVLLHERENIFREVAELVCLRSGRGIWPVPTDYWLNIHGWDIDAIYYFIRTTVALQALGHY